jgi:5-oxoprolinase (ATP-hydrolysing)
MDDGTPIELRVSIDEDKGSAVFDFEGTGDEVLGNVSGLAREETSVTF